MLPVSSSDIPLPPSELQMLVAGHRVTEERFLAKGAEGAEIVQARLEAQGTSLSSMERVLEWGCGCGRILRHLNTPDRPELHGCDINSQLVGWCETNLPFVCVARNGIMPPLPYEDESFGLVFCFSVFTHLSEPAHHAWMREISRVLRADGFFLFSTRGGAPWFLSALAPAELARFQAGEFVYRVWGDEGSNQASAWHPRSWVLEELVQGWDLLDHMPQGATCVGGQDLWMVRKA